jgi:hypothetical protein
MGKPGSKLTSQGKGYLLTITNANGLETRIKISSNGRMHDLAGRYIIQSDVTAAVLQFRGIGQFGMAENVIKWWNTN